MNYIEYFTSRFGAPSNTIGNIPVFRGHCVKPTGPIQITIVHTVDIRRVKRKHQIKIIGPYTTENFITSVVTLSEDNTLYDLLKTYKLPIKAIIC